MNRFSFQACHPNFRPVSPIALKAFSPRGFTVKYPNTQNQTPRRSPQYLTTLTQLTPFLCSCLCLSILPVTQTGSLEPHLTILCTPLSSPSFCRSLLYTPAPTAATLGCSHLSPGLCKHTDFLALPKLKRPFSSSQAYVLPRGVNSSSWLFRPVTWLYPLHNLTAHYPHRRPPRVKWTQPSSMPLLTCFSLLFIIPKPHHSSKPSSTPLLRKILLINPPTHTPELLGTFWAHRYDQVLR